MESRNKASETQDKMVYKCDEALRGFSLNLFHRISAFDSFITPK